MRPSSVCNMRVLNDELNPRAFTAAAVTPTWMKSSPGTPLSAGARQLLEKFTGEDWPALFRLRLSAAQDAEIRKYLHDFLIWHLGKLPRARTAALEME